MWSFVQARGKGTNQSRLRIKGDTNHHVYKLTCLQICIEGDFRYRYKFILPSTLPKCLRIDRKFEIER